MRFEIDDSGAKVNFDKIIPENTKNRTKLSELKDRKLEIEKNTKTMTPSEKPKLLEEYKNIQKEIKLIEENPWKDFGDYEVKLSDILQHNELFKQYPKLKEVIVQPTTSIWESGSYNASSNTIKVSVLELNNPEKLKSTLLHEIQHAIQEKEWFALWGSPKAFTEWIEYQKKLVEQNRDILWDIRYNKMLEKDKTWAEYKKLLKEEEEALIKYRTANEKYKKLTDTSPMESYNNQAWEVEARNVQTRMNMTAKERALKSVESTEDVPRLKQIVRLKNDGTSMSASKAGTMDMSKAPDALVQEARKYKSADEFINAQWKPVYHWTKYKFDTFSKEKIWSSVWSDKEWIFFTNSKILASRYADSINENWILKRWIIMEAYPAMNNPLTIESKGTPLSYFTSNKENILKKAKKGGFDGVVVRDKVWDENIIIAFNPEQIKTEAQLKQIYDQANKK